MDLRFACTTAAAEEEEGATDVTEIVATAGTPLARLTAEGEKEHVDPIGKFPAQVSITELLKLLAGVMVSIVVPVWPAVMTIGDGVARAKSGVVTFIATDCGMEALKLASPL